MRFENKAKMEYLKAEDICAEYSWVRFSHHRNYFNLFLFLHRTEPCFAYERAEWKWILNIFSLASTMMHNFAKKYAWKRFIYTLKCFFLQWCTERVTFWLKFMNSFLVVCVDVLKSHSIYISSCVQCSAKTIIT